MQAIQHRIDIKIGKKINGIADIKNFGFVKHLTIRRLQFSKKLFFSGL